MNIEDLDDYFFIYYPKQVILEEYNLYQFKNLKSKPKVGHTVCKKCNSNEIWINVVQTRSGDEGATTFFKCNNCKSLWNTK